MEKVCFRVLGPSTCNSTDLSRIYLNSNVFRPGDKISSPDNWNNVGVIQNPPISTSKGWLYQITAKEGKFDWKEGTVIEHVGSSNYSETPGEWDKVYVPEVVLTPHQAVKLAIETLENFEDEYSDVGPIIEKLKRSLEG